MIIHGTDTQIAQTHTQQWKQSEMLQYTRARALVRASLDGWFVGCELSLRLCHVVTVVRNVSFCCVRVSGCVCVPCFCGFYYTETYPLPSTQR